LRIHFILEPDSAEHFLELGKLAESLGFEAVWTANHLGARDLQRHAQPLVFGKP